MYEEIMRKLREEGLGKNDKEFAEYQKLLDENWAKLVKYNSTPMYNLKELNKGISELLGYQVDENTKVLSPFRCDLGFNIRLGKNVVINYNCTFLDSAPITIGDNTLIAPDCHLVTAYHPIEADKRHDWTTYAKPITIGKDCWLGTNVTVLPGITIGDGAVVGAGSVVTKNVPKGAVVAGNPAKPIH